MEEPLPHITVVFFLSLCKCPSLGDDAGEEQHTR